MRQHDQKGKEEKQKSTKEKPQKPGEPRRSRRFPGSFFGSRRGKKRFPSGERGEGGRRAAKSGTRGARSEGGTDAQGEGNRGAVFSSQKRRGFDREGQKASGAGKTRTIFLSFS